MDTQGPTLACIRTLTRIGKGTDKIALIERQVRSDVEFAREQGASWRMIAVALGVTTQSAWERYRPSEGARPIAGQGSLFDQVSLAET